MTRRANKNDIKRIIELLHQVNMVHHVIRPDLFKPNTTKYDEQELETLLNDDSKPIFVYDDGEVQGYAFCQITEVKKHKLLGTTLHLVSTEVWECRCRKPQWKPYCNYLRLGLAFEPKFVVRKSFSDFSIISLSCGVGFSSLRATCRNLSRYVFDCWLSSRK